MSGIPNSEILLIYEAKLCNPNGDPDEENKPRIDTKTNLNLVSDLRLKRFFRDYIAEKFGEEFIYVTKIAGEHVRADQRVFLLGKEKMPSDKIREEIKRTREEREEIVKEIVKKAEEVPRRFIDARLFGATVPIGMREGRGAQRTFIGPVQFTWGFSFHPVELVESSTITSIFAGREAEEQYGTIGKDWRLYYSLIGFYGVISGRRAISTGLSEDDIKILDDVLWRSLTVQPTTRSKIGERPHLYLRVEYRDADTLFGDFRRFVDVKPKETVRNFEDVGLSFNKLTKFLEEIREKISKIYISCSEEMKPFQDDIQKTFGEILRILPHGLRDEEILKILGCQ